MPLTQAQVEQRLGVLGQFVTVGVSGRRFQAKLKVAEDGSFVLQPWGPGTWWDRKATDSLTNEAVYMAVRNVFRDCLGRMVRMRSNDRKVLYRKMLYGLRGYHTLVKEGYPTLRTEVAWIGALICGALQTPEFGIGIGLAVRDFKQGDFLPPANGGLCWGFVMDWLRRCFRGRFDYHQTQMKTGIAPNRVVVRGQTVRALPTDKIQRKIGRITVQQSGQNQLINDVKGGFTLFEDLGPGGPQAVGTDPKFARMLMHPQLPNIHIDLAQQRFYGNDIDGAAQLNPFTVLLLQMQAMAQIAPGADIGWIIAMRFNDFWRERPSVGHAIGAFWSPREGVARFFDPNSGWSGSNGDFAALGRVAGTPAWIEGIVEQYSMNYAVASLEVYPVKYLMPGNP